MGGNGVTVGDSLTTTAGFNVGGTVWDPDNVDTSTSIASFTNNHISGMIPSSFTAGLSSSAPLIDTGTGFWGLGFSMDLTGTVSAWDGTSIDIDYSSGIISLWAILNDPVDAGELIAKNVLDFSVISSGTIGPNFLVNGFVSTSGDEDPIFANFFNIVGADCAGDNSFVALTNCMPPIEISFQLDQNLDNPTFLIA